LNPTQPRSDVQHETRVFFDSVPYGRWTRKTATYILPGTVQVRRHGRDDCFRDRTESATAVSSDTSLDGSRQFKRMYRSNGYRKKWKKPKKKRRNLYTAGRYSTPVSSSRDRIRFGTSTGGNGDCGGARATASNGPYEKYLINFATGTGRRVLPLLFLLFVLLLLLLLLPPLFL